jgi:hypothetical protein
MGSLGPMARARAHGRSAARTEGRGGGGSTGGCAQWGGEQGGRDPWQAREELREEALAKEEGRGGSPSPAPRSPPAATLTSTASGRRWPTWCRVGPRRLLQRPWPYIWPSRAERIRAVSVRDGQCRLQGRMGHPACLPFPSCCPCPTHHQSPTHRPTTVLNGTDRPLGPGPSGPALTSRGAASCQPGSTGRLGTSHVQTALPVGLGQAKVCTQVWIRVCCQEKREQMARLPGLVRRGHLVPGRAAREIELKQQKRSSPHPRHSLWQI